MSEEDCRKCGRCCAYYTIIPVQPDDAVGDDLLRHDDETGQLGMKRIGGACIAFDRATRLCTIYAIRPQACREVQRDDCMCREARGAAE